MIRLISADSDTIRPLRTSRREASRALTSLTVPQREASICTPFLSRRHFAYSVAYVMLVDDLASTRIVPVTTLVLSVALAGDDGIKVNAAPSSVSFQPTISFTDPLVIAALVTFK